jgi:hypothetical protein
MNTIVAGGSPGGSKMTPIYPESGETSELRRGDRVMSTNPRFWPYFWSNNVSGGPPVPATVIRKSRSKRDAGKYDIINDAGEELLAVPRGTLILVRDAGRSPDVVTERITREEFPEMY